MIELNQWEAIKQLAGELSTEEYERYQAEVPRIFPRRIALTPLFSAVSLSQALKNREGRTVLGIVFVLTVMFLKLRYPF